MAQEKNLIVVTSGGFDPLHIGHVRMFQEAKQLGSKHIVILNNDHWLRAKKGFVFMPEKEREEILHALDCVDEVILSFHTKGTTDLSVAAELQKIQPHIFANGGDRKHGNIPEAVVCKSLGIQPVFNVGHGGKVQSSSGLVKKYQQRKDAYEA